ncbi:hypothetical protein EK904_008342 [Melospiza melodia maxima]|nr:hypothetical protein EK904_008342 [Melospiza melodia maxima]
MSLSKNETFSENHILGQEVFSGWFVKLYLFADNKTTVSTTNDKKTRNKRPIKVSSVWYYYHLSQGPIWLWLY